MKRFLIITQGFPPDPAAVGQYLNEAALALVEDGNDVEVLTAIRGYDNPAQVFEAEEVRSGIRIRRLKFASLGKANLTIRIFAQLSFTIQCILRGLFTPKLTALLVSTSPPMAAICAVILGCLRPRLKVHYWVMDINPDQAVAIGKFGERHPLVLAMNWLNRRILKRADSVITLDRFMKARLEQKLNSPEDELRSAIQVIPPWPMDDHIEPVAHAENPFRNAQGWKDKFVVMYSGNHSIVHPLDTILDAAEQLADDPRFIFVFIGGGKGKERVDYRIAAENHITDNLVSLPYQSLDQIRYTLSAADLHLVSLGENMSGIVHPCKVYGALANGRPVLALGPPESYLNDIIETESFGLSIEHGDVDAAVIALKRTADQSEGERAAMQTRASEVVQTNFDRTKLINDFLKSVSA
ncbi:MAG: glycosyltransferase [Verrucomicrobia bacterium]|nr:glycosyltransferase [Verrucomicrobiota bacterium]